MNLRVSVIAGAQLPIADPTGASDPYVIIFQNAHTRTQVGMTQAIPQNLNPVWNYQTEIHAIRGMRLKFAIFDYDTHGAHDRMGKAYFDPFYHPMGTEVWLPVIPDMAESLLPPGWQPRILVKVERIEAKVTQHPQPGSPIPANQIIYANLSFDPPYMPPLPIHLSGFGAIACPLDIGIVAFNNQGKIKTVCYNSEPLGEGCQHTGKILSFCYDTYGPSLRIDVGSLFTGADPAIRAVVVVSSNSPQFPLSSFNWITSDFYVTQEKMMKTMDGRLMCNDPQVALPYFHSRSKTAYIQGATVAVAAVLVPTPMGVVLQPMNWAAPNAIVPFQPLSLLEVLPELAMCCQLPPQFVSRRIACVPGCPASINRAMAVQGYQQLVPITVGLGWDTNTDLDASVLIYSNKMQMMSTVFYNHLKEFNGAVCHSGDNRTGDRAGDDERVTVDLNRLPPNVAFLVVVITSFKEVPFTSVKSSYLRLMIGQGQEIFRLNLKKSAKKTGLMFATIFRMGPGQWGILPNLRFAKFNTPVKIQPFVKQTLQQTFGNMVM